MKSFQLTEEKLGTAEKTELDAHFVSDIVIKIKVVNFLRSN